MAQSYKTIHAFKTISVDSVTSQVHNITGNSTLTSSHSGDFIILNSTTATTITLPAPDAGYRFHIAVGNTASHLISAPSACIVGGVCNAIASTSASLATGAAKTSVRFTAGNSIGDSIELVGNGTRYFLTGLVANAGGLVYVS